MTDMATPVAGTRSVSRALAILTLLAGHDRPLSLTTIATSLGVPKSSALNLLRALAADHFVDESRGGYALGRRTFDVGAAYLRSMTPVVAVEPELVALTEHLGVTSHFAVLDGDDVVYLAKHDAPGTVRLASSLGARLPARVTAVGKAQLAVLTDDASLSGVRSVGFAVDEGDTAAGIRCVAAAVMSASGCVGAIGISHLLRDDLPLDRVAPLVVDAARSASLRLGDRSAVAAG